MEQEGRNNVATGGDLTMNERIVHYDARVQETAEFFIDNNRIPLGLAEGDPRRDELVKKLASRIARAIDWFVEEAMPPAPPDEGAR